MFDAEIRKIEEGKVEIHRYGIWAFMGFRFDCIEALHTHPLLRN